MNHLWKRCYDFVLSINGNKTEFLTGYSINKNSDNKFSDASTQTGQTVNNDVFTSTSDEMVVIF